MRKYIIKRVLHAIPILIFISIVSFLLIKLAPGDPIRTFINPKMKASDIARIRHNLGLDRPIHIQYILWLKNVLKGDLGYSLINSRPIATQITERLPATLLLMGSSLLISLVLGIIFGVISAVNKNNFIDNLISVISYIGISIPSFWFAMILIYIFSVNLNLLPSVGMHTIDVDSKLDVLKHLILPCTVLSFSSISVISRYIRSNTISELSEDYVMIAYAKGLSKKKILYKHVLKNALLPIITILGMSLPDIFAGAFITETIFGWPGMGRLGMKAILGFDYPLIMSITMLSSILLIIGNLIADVCYTLADPRIKN
ncbi:ABC transporter permease [Clostridium sp. Marseille-Q2269]|uniref:ABC transporter permease n=1 Tax=Clostridium sp. Marseille-Q2269 TaxID=2942205 RepID=UPI002072EFD8|nr:ABC transporter permease [Clostridium sp. Marseille-Q2269]